MKNYNKMYDEPSFETFEEETEVIQETPLPRRDELGTVNAREVYIRKGPGKDFEHIGTVKQGDVLTILDREGDFLKIETEDGAEAYIMESFVDVD